MRLLPAAFLSAAISVSAYAQPNRAPENGPVRIGIAGPMTGDYASNGIMMRDAARAFERYINGRGGILGRMLEIRVYDDVCDPRQAVSVANLAQDQVSFLVGHFCSGATMAARNTYREAGMPMITLSQVDEVTGEAYPNLFRINPSNGVIARRIAEAITEIGGPVAIIHSNDAYGRGLKNLLNGLLTERNVMVQAHEFSDNRGDFSAIATRVRASGTPTVFLAGTIEGMGRIARQLRSDGYNGRIVTPGVGTLPEYAQAAGCSNAQGTVAIASRDSTYAPENAYVREALNAAGYQPRDNILFAWVALDVFVQAITRAGSLNAGAVIRVLRETEFDTPQGRLSSGPLAGNLNNPPVARYMWHCENGRAVLRQESQPARP